MDREGEQRDEESVRNQKRKWSKPPDNWVKCNFGVKWVKKHHIVGAAWIVRDSTSESLLHSGRYFSGISSFKEAKLQALVWTLDCMAAHRFDKIILAGEDVVLMKVIERPKAWPSFTSVYLELKNFLGKFDCWKSKLESRSSNRCAYLMAESATTIQWNQSYVATSAPGWLLTLISFEKV